LFGSFLPSAPLSYPLSIPCSLPGRTCSALISNFVEDVDWMFLKKDSPIEFLLSIYYTIPSIIND
jgi:hypothetical protein